MMTGQRCLLIVLTVVWTPLTADAADGTWAVAASGNWSDSAKWMGGVVPSGIDSTANFTVDHSNSIVITVDTSRTIGHLSFAAGRDWNLRGTGVLTLSTSSGTPTIHATFSSADIGNVIAGNQGLHKTGPSPLFLGAPNTYTGETVISGGFLQFFSESALGHPSNGVTLDGGKLLVPAVFPGNFSLSRNIMLTTAPGNTVYNSGGTCYLNGVISGSGGVTFAGGSVFILTANNNYEGETTIDVDVVRAVDGIGLPSASNLVLQNGTFESNGSFTRGLGTGSGQVRWTGNSGFSAFGGPLTVQIGGNTETLTWGSTNFVSGVLRLNAFSADSLVEFQNGIDLGGGARTINVVDNPASVTDLAQISGPISNGDLTKRETGILILTGTNNYGNTFIGMPGPIPQLGNGGTLQVGVGGSNGTLGSGAVTFASGTLANRLVFNRNDEYTFAGAIVSAATNNTIVQQGIGTTILTGDLSGYNGSFSLSSGTLLVNTTVGGTGSVTVNAGATFGGTGELSGTVTVNASGTLSPGPSIESLEVGSLFLAAGAILDFELDSVLGVDQSDLVRVTAANGLTVHGGTLNLINAGSMTDGTYTLIDYAGNLNGSFNNITLGSTPAAFSFSLIHNTTNTSIDLIVASTGDFNHDGTVDAADYVVWRKNDGTPEGYETWRVNFGAQSLATRDGSGFSSNTTIPEPHCASLLLIAAGFGASRRRWKTNRRNESRVAF